MSHSASTSQEFDHILRIYSHIISLLKAYKKSKKIAHFFLAKGFFIHYYCSIEMKKGEVVNPR
jgi:hypothetical protein